VLTRWASFHSLDVVSVEPAKVQDAPARPEDVQLARPPTSLASGERRKQTRRGPFEQQPERGRNGKDKKRGTHEERRPAAAADAERARAALDELDRPRLDERVKVLLELILGRKGVLDRVLLCWFPGEAGSVGGQRGRSRKRGGRRAAARPARAGRVPRPDAVLERETERQRTRPLLELLLEPGSDGVDVECAERARRRTSGGCWVGKPAEGARREGIEGGEEKDGAAMSGAVGFWRPSRAAERGRLGRKQ